MMYYTWGVMLPPPPPKAFQTVRKYEIHSAETLIWGSFRTMSVRSGGDPPVKFSPETKYFRVPMETVHVILVVSGPSSIVYRWKELDRYIFFESEFRCPALAFTRLPVRVLTPASLTQ